MFQIQNLSEEDAADLLHLLLSNGVPPTALSRALSLDIDFIRGIQNQVRVQRYGTAEIAEAMNWLMWEAFDEAVDLLHTGSPTNRIRAVAMVLPRSVGMAAKQDPEEFSRARSVLEQMLREQAEVPLITEQQPGQFVVGEHADVD